jgi:hypothetical protein
MIAKQTLQPKIGKQSKARSECQGLASSHALNRRSENVIVEAVIIPKLELSDIERQILCTDFVERADDTALEDAPKAFNRLSVHRTDNVLPLSARSE